MIVASVVQAPPVSASLNLTEQRPARPRSSEHGFSLSLIYVNENHGGGLSLSRNKPLGKAIAT